MLYPEGCAIKYIVRHRDKGKKQDLEKELDTLLKSTKTPSTAGQTPPIVTDEGKTTVTGTMDQPTPEPKLFEDDDLYSMDEENIKERAKFFEEMLAKDKKQKVFDALIAGYKAAIKAKINDIIDTYNKSLTSTLTGTVLIIYTSEFIRLCPRIYSIKATM